MLKYQSIDLASNKAAPDTQPSTLVVARTLPFGAVVWTFEFHIKKFRQVVLSADDNYVVGIGLDIKTGKEYVRVYQRRGTFLHRVNLKYPHFKEIIRIVPFSGFNVVLPVPPAV